MTTSTARLYRGDDMLPKRRQRGGRRPVPATWRILTNAEVVYYLREAGIDDDPSLRLTRIMVTHPKDLFWPKAPVVRYDSIDFCAETGIKLDPPRNTFFERNSGPDGRLGRIPDDSRIFSRDIAAILRVRRTVLAEHHSFKRWLDCKWVADLEEVLQKSKVVSRPILENVSVRDLQKLAYGNLSGQSISVEKKEEEANEERMRRFEP